MDLASASQGDNKIAWYENMDGKGTFGSQRSCRRVRRLVVYLRLTWTEMETWTWHASVDDNKIAWYENLVGYVTLGEIHEGLSVDKVNIMIEYM